MLLWICNSCCESLNTREHIIHVGCAHAWNFGFQEPERGTLCVHERKGEKNAALFFSSDILKNRGQRKFYENCPTDTAGGERGRQTDREASGGLTGFTGGWRQRDGKVLWERGRNSIQRVSGDRKGPGRLIDLNWWEWRERGERVSGGDRAATVGVRLHDAVKEHDGRHGSTDTQQDRRKRQKSGPWANSCNFYYLHLLN